MPPQVLLLHAMLNLEPWKYYPLTLQVLDSKYTTLTRGCAALPPHMQLVIAPMEVCEGV